MKHKRVKLRDIITHIFQQVFLRTVGSWGACIVIDENGNVIDHDE